jgi:hypothetical protein
MTANYTSKGMDEGFEAAIMIDDKNADFFNKTICAWDSLCNWELRTNATLGDIMGEALVYRSGNKDLEKVAVVERDARELKPVTTNSVEDMVNYKPEVKTDNNGQVRYKKVIFSYKVLPPTLPSDAVQAEGIDTGLEVYKKKGQHYIVIDRWEQIQNAIENNKFNARIVARP